MAVSTDAAAAPGLQLTQTPPPALAGPRRTLLRCCASYDGAVLPVPTEWTALLRHHALTLLEPPWVWGASASPRVDLAILRARAVGGGVVLTDIPDDWDNLERALAVPGVVGAIAVACEGIDLWVGRAFELRLDVPLRRTTETSAARYELRDAGEAEVVLLALAALVAEGVGGGG